MKTKKIAIVITLFGFLCFFVTWFLILPLWKYRPPKAKVLVTKTMLKNLCLELLIFKEENGRYPIDFEEWADWLELAKNDEERRGRFLDGWGRPIRYVINQPKLNVGKFDLYSVGRNGIDEYNKSDFGDDIHVREDHSVSNIK